MCSFLVRVNGLRLANRWFPCRERPVCRSVYKARHIGRALHLTATRFSSDDPIECHSGRQWHLVFWRVTSTALPLYIIRFEETAYHQNEVLYLIKPQGYTLRVMRYTYGDDIRMYTSPSARYTFNDIPSLRLGYKKDQVFRLGLF